MGWCKLLEYKSLRCDAMGRDIAVSKGGGNAGRARSQRGHVRSRGSAALERRAAPLMHPVTDLLRFHYAGRIAASGVIGTSRCRFEPQVCPSRHSRWRERVRR
jgi:hypothetical protein